MAAVLIVEIKYGNIRSRPVEINGKLKLLIQESDSRGSHFLLEEIQIKCRMQLFTKIVSKFIL